MHYRFGSFQMDLDRFELCRDGEPVEIQPKSFDVLRYLLENAERIVPKQELLDQLWPGVVVGEAALTSAVREARRALGEKERDATILQTLRRRGYRIAVPVTVVTAERAPAPEPASARDGTALASAGETPGSEAAVPRPAAAPERDPLAYPPLTSPTRSSDRGRPSKGSASR
jgi:DNA-binding winged helix-turn-helix (wHTH) protein